MKILSDYRFGRNIVRTLLQYYRFTNVLNIPMVKDLKVKKLKKTRRSRSRSRRELIIKPRPQTTRAYAPISYTDLELLHGYSSTSNEGSPTRSGFGARCNRNIYLDSIGDSNKRDQYSLISIQTAKFQQLDFGDNKSRHSSPTKIDGGRGISNQDVIISVAPKPSLSIIDFNQLTRGGLEQAKRSESEARCRNIGKSEGHR